MYSKKVILKILIVFIFSSTFCSAYNSKSHNDKDEDLYSKVVFDFEGKDQEKKWNVVLSKYGNDNSLEYSHQNLIRRNPLSKILSTNSLFIRSSFLTKGYNYVDIYIPSDKKIVVDEKEIFEPKSIPIEGRVDYISIWVWSHNFDYSLEVHLKDTDGYIRRVYLGDLYHVGWKNLHISMPQNIKQKTRFYDKNLSLSFVKFRIRSSVTALKEDFYCFIDDFKVITDLGINSFNGSDAIPIFNQGFTGK